MGGKDLAAPAAAAQLLLRLLKHEQHNISKASLK
jgi:hypothetical protein